MAETLTGQTPLFGGSTGGLLSKAEEEEKYAITWTSPKEQVFEMPTGGAATMRQGENLLYLARKEQCMALGTQFRVKFRPKIEDYKIYRVYPSGETQYLHPADGVFPEKVNQGRGSSEHHCSQYRQQSRASGSQVHGSEDLRIAAIRSIALLCLFVQGRAIESTFAALEAEPKLNFDRKSCSADLRSAFVSTSAAIAV